MLLQARLPKVYWAEAVNTAVYVRNRVITSALKPEATPFECWFGKKPDVSKLRVFGCVAYAHVPDKERKKLDKKAEKMRFMGYSENRKGYRLIDETTHKVSVRYDVIFNEGSFGTDSASVLINDDDEETEEVVDGGLQDAERSSFTRPRRDRKPPTRYGFDEYADVAMEGEPHHSALHVADVMEPETIQQALKSPESSQWKRAADEEIASLKENDTWDLVELPEGKRVVGCKWVFKTKHDKNGQVERFKARLVARGFAQTYGIDYEETFSPVVRFSSIRVLLAFAVQRGMLIHQMDVVTAFLNGELAEEIFMEQPPGFVQTGEEELVCKLKKSLYGLKQSPRCWNIAFCKFMTAQGFEESVADPCIFIRRESVLSIVAVYVDDLIIITESEDEMDCIKGALKNRFKMKDMGILHYCLGVSVEYDDVHGRVKIGQAHYIRKMLERYGLGDANPVSVPMNPNVHLVKDDGYSKPVDAVRYQSIVGSLIYAATGTRPDIAQAVAVVSKFNGCPTEANMTAVKRILRYLKGTIDLTLQYVKGSDHGLVGYSDADWAGNLDDRHSTTGNVFLLSGAATTWLSRKQPTVTLSTSEAEYVAMSSAAQEIIWLRSLLNELGLSTRDPTILFEDNRGAIALSKNPVSHKRTKHIDIRYHFVRETVEAGTINICYCPTSDMLADMFTKPIPKTRFEMLRTKIGLKAD